MKKLFLALLVFGLTFGLSGKANALVGAYDDVPGSDVFVPIICEVGGGMDTLISLANTDGVNATDYHYVIYNYRSEEKLDDDGVLTAWDVQDFSCSEFMADMSSDARDTFIYEIDGVEYYVGYVWFSDLSGVNRLIGWAYLTDLTKGFASGFNPYSAEWGSDGVTLNEGGSTVALSANNFYPRYFLLNDKVDTWNWWIFMQGTPHHGYSSPSCDVGTIDIHICDSEENCVSTSICVPYDVTVVDMSEFLPAKVCSSRPCGGFAILDIGEDYPDDDATSIFGWSYQRAQSDSLAATWDVIHPMHRDSAPVSP